MENNKWKITKFKCAAVTDFPDNSDNIIVFFIQIYIWVNIRD